MKKKPFSQAQFCAAIYDEKGLPSFTDLQGRPLPEIAIIGRSNVGKSSLINHLLKNKTLAKTSSTPGKTQSINFFKIDDQLILVDLPGYGYAKIPQKMRQNWGSLVDLYLKERTSLKLILLLIDSRRDLTLEDQQMIDWATFHKKPLLLLFTKSDKLSSAEKERRKMPAVLYYSIKDPQARIALIETLNTLLHTHGTD